VLRACCTARQDLALIGVEVTVDDSKARRELGYVASVSLEEGLNDLKQRYTAQLPSQG
jgi:nucleoside-diphosphate-sugar epimerase